MEFQTRIGYLSKPCEKEEWGRETGREVFSFFTGFHKLGSQFQTGSMTRLRDQLTEWFVYLATHPRLALAVHSARDVAWRICVLWMSALAGTWASWSLASGFAEQVFRGKLATSLGLGLETCSIAFGRCFCWDQSPIRYKRRDQRPCPLWGVSSAVWSTTVFHKNTGGKIAWGGRRRDDYYCKGSRGNQERVCGHAGMWRREDKNSFFPFYFLRFLFKKQHSSYVFLNL